MADESECLQAVEKLKATFATGKTKPLEWRIAQLKALQKMITENESLFAEALAKDLGRSLFEAVGLELIPTAMEITEIISNLKSWAKPVRTSVPALMAPAISEYVYEPYGVCLIISAFNYPIQLTLGPLLGAIMAGNCAVIKVLISSFFPTASCEQYFKTIYYFLYVLSLFSRANWHPLVKKCCE